MKEIKLRKAVPNDAENAVPLVMQSGPETFAYVFDNGKQSAKEFLMHAFRKKGGEFSFDNHYVLLEGDVLIGTIALYTAKKANSFLVSDVLNIFNIYKWRGFGVLKRGLKVEQVLLLPKGDECYIGHVAISNQYRARGHGQYMLKAAMSYFLESHEVRFVLDVSVDNPRAKALYARLGFRDQRFMPSDLKSNYGEVPSHHRMVKLDTEILLLGGET